MDGPGYLEREVIKTVHYDNKGRVVLISVDKPVPYDQTRWPYQCPSCKRSPSGINDWHIGTVDNVGVCIMFCEKCWQKSSVADKLEFAQAGYSTIELDQEGGNWSALATYIWSGK